MQKSRKGVFRFYFCRNFEGVRNGLDEIKFTCYKFVEMHPGLGTNKTMMFVRVNLGSKLDTSLNQTFCQHRGMLVMDVVCMKAQLAAYIASCNTWQIIVQIRKKLSIFYMVHILQFFLISRLNKMR